METALKENIYERSMNDKVNFLLIIIGRLVSSLGTAIFNFALSLYVLDITGSAGAFSMILSFTILPGVIVNILAGPIVDKSSKKKVIVISDFLSGASVLGFMAVFGYASKSIMLLLVCAIVLSVFQAFFGLAINSSVPEIVKRENVSKANSALQGISSVINIVGPVLGAIAYSVLGMKMIFLINSISFILAALAELFLCFSVTDKNSVKIEGNYFKNIMFVFQYLNEQKIIKFFLVFATLINFIYNPLMLVVLRFINYKIIGTTGLQLSIIQAGWAIGSVIGAVFVSTRRSVNPIIRRFFLLLLVQAMLIILWFFPVIPIFALSSKFAVTVIYTILLVVIGLLNTAQNIPVVSYFQTQVPRNLRASVFGVLNSALLISSPLGMWVYGILLEKVNWIYITTFSGIVMILFVIFAGGSKEFRKFSASLKDGLSEN